MGWPGGTLAMLSAFGSDVRIKAHGDAVTSGGRQVEGPANWMPRGPGQGLRRVLSFMWAFLPALSFGYLAPLPIINAAVRLRTWTLWAAAASYTAAVIFVLSATMTVTSGPVEPAEVSDPPGWAAALLFGLIVVRRHTHLPSEGGSSSPGPRIRRSSPPSTPGSGGRRRGRSRPATSSWPASFGSAVPTCRGSSTTAGWWTSTMRRPPSWSSCWGCLKVMQPWWSRHVTASAGSPAPRRLSPIPTYRPHSSTAFVSGWCFSADLVVVSEVQAVTLPATGGLTCGVVVRGCPLLAADPGWFAAPARPTVGHAEGTAGEKRTWLRRCGDGHKLGRWARLVLGDNLPRWQAAEGSAAGVVYPSDRVRRE
jgi:hypothetical protein